MTRYFTAQDLEMISFIPRERIDQLAQEMDSVFKRKVGANNDSEWDSFLETLERARTSKYAAQTVQVKPQATHTLKKDTASSERRTHN